MIRGSEVSGFVCLSRHPPRIALDPQPPPHIVSQVLTVAGTHGQKLRMRRLLVVSPLYYMRR